jgi:hypothetical protein
MSAPDRKAETHISLATQAPSTHETLPKIDDRQGDAAPLPGMMTQRGFRLHLRGRGVEPEPPSLLTWPARGGGKRSG